MAASCRKSRHCLFGSAFYVIEIAFYEIKNAPRDAHSREEETCRKRPRSARECAKAHSFLLPSISTIGPVDQFWFTRATSQSPCLHESLVVLSANGACLAPAGAGRKCRDNLRNQKRVFLITYECSWLKCKDTAVVSKKKGWTSCTKKYRPIWTS